MHATSTPSAVTARCTCPSDAAAEADLFVNGQWKSGYSLDTIEKAFVRGSSEAILTISSDGSNRGVVNHNYIGRTYIPSSSVRATYYLTDDFMGAFEEGDLRKANWTKQFTARAPFVYYPNKYKLRVAPQNAEDAEDQILFRLAEVLLIHAEANAQLNKLPEALSSLNKIRERAGLLPLSANLSKEEVLLAVEQERRLELFSEYGHRWVDLVRTGRADAVLGKHKATTWKSYAQLFPVPEKDIELNPNLTQNPGYNAQ
ncbi:MAG: RagB/SusD family nutrient uptake outer membrane protein [Leadbetterella sp.]|nr:RagB/SusD family nutrient uptake outer membrane protein [Leadbetterella sp.]